MAKRKRLVITYGDVELYNAEPETVSWRETAGGAIKIEAGPQQDNPLTGLIQGLQQRAQQAQTQQPQQLEQ